MTVSELIELLKPLDQGLLVLVNGYEGGCTVPKEPQVVDVWCAPYDDPYIGKYRETEIYDSKDEAPVFKAVLLER